MQSYGPTTKQRAWAPTAVFVGVATCVLHLLFPVISGALFAASGPALEDAINGLTATMTGQVRCY